VVGYLSFWRDGIVPCQLRRGSKVDEVSILDGREARKRKVVDDSWFLFCSHP